MNKPYMGGLVAAIAVVVGGGAFLLAPLLQSSQARSQATVEESTERARRLLDQFSENQKRMATLLEALRESGVGTAIDDVPQVLDSEENRTAVEAEDARLQELVRKAADAGLEERFLKALYGPQGQQHLETRRRNLGRSVDQQVRSLCEGLKERDRLWDQNKKLLEEALRVVDQGLSMPGGDQDVPANRVKAIILFFLGQTRSADGVASREEAGRFRSKLVSLGLEGQGLLKEKELVVLSGIDAHLAAAEQAVNQAQESLAKLRVAAGAAQSEMEQTQGRIAELRTAADRVRADMDRLQSVGADLTNPQGFEKFAREYEALARVHRESLSELHRLESGTLRNARIDASGDLIRGRYVPAESGPSIEVDTGLVGLEAKLAQLQLQVAAAEQAVETAAALREALTARRAEYQERSAQAAARLETLAQQASTAYAELVRWSGAAEKAEAAAADYYRKSAGAFATAARSAGARSGAANAAVSKLTGDALKRSPKNAVAQDAWLEQQYQVNATSAQIELGRLYAVVSEETGRTADVLAGLPKEWLPSGADPVAWRERQTHARTEGIKVLQMAYDALQRTRGRLQGDWTVAAQAATAADLLALLGETDLRNVALGLYEAVVTGQENQPHMQAYLGRLNALRHP